MELTTSERLLRQAASFIWSVIRRIGTTEIAHSEGFKSEVESFGMRTAANLQLAAKMAAITPPL